MCFSQIDDETDNNWNFTNLNPVDSVIFGKNILGIMNNLIGTHKTKKIITLGIEII